MQRDAAIVEFKNVDVVLEGKKILENISFTLQPKEILTVIGLNGTGKTTLLRSIIGFHQPARGEIKVKTRRIGYVPQKLDFDRTMPFAVAELLQIYSGAGREQVMEKLLEVGGGRLLDRKIGSLSGGELQRVLIANALLRRPELLLLDEPTAGIDIAGEQDFYHLIATIFARYALAIVVVSHDIHAVFSRATRVLCLDRGIRCQGTPHDVSHHPAFREIFGEYLLPYHHHHD